MDPAELWRRWRRLPAPSSGFGAERAEAFLMACAVHAAMEERTVSDVAKAFAKKKE